MDMITAMLTQLFVEYPWLGPAFAALYFTSEGLGASKTIKENTVYQSIMTFMRGIFSKFYTKVESKDTPNEK